MDIETRVQVCRIIEKINKSPEYAKRITLQEITKSQNATEKSELKYYVR